MSTLCSTAQQKHIHANNLFLYHTSQNLVFLKTLYLFILIYVFLFSKTLVLSMHLFFQIVSFSVQVDFWALGKASQKLFTPQHLYSSKHTKQIFLSTLTTLNIGLGLPAVTVCSSVKKSYQLQRKGLLKKALYNML